MQTYLDKTNTFAAGLILVVLGWALVAGGALPLVAAPFFIVWLARRAVRQSVEYTENIVAVLLALLWLVLCLYDVMFALIEVKSFLKVGDDEHAFVVQCGAVLLYCLLLGNAVALMLARPARPARPPAANPLSPLQVDLLFVLAWLPLLLNAAVYMGAYAGRDYVAVHGSDGGAAGFLLKGIYLSFGAVLNLCVGAPADRRLRRRFVLLSAAYVVIYGMLFKLRSPLLFYGLLLFFFYGRKLAFFKLALGTLAVLAFLLSVAMLRDPTLGEANGSFALINMLVNFGDFADTLNFARQYLASNGPLWGGSIAGGLLGFGEPLANIYAKSISVDYFDSGGGFGFFFLSEIYMNFGYVGAMLFLFALGFGLVRFNQVRGRDSVTMLAAIVFANVLALVRNDVGGTVRGIVYTLVAALLVCLVINIYRPRTKLLARQA